jgi:hypothetical protein
MFGATEFELHRSEKLTHRWSINFFAAYLVVWSSGNCRAQDLGVAFSARAEVGLDPATRELIQTLPAAWRPRIAAIVSDTLNEVDVHFDKYVDRIDKLITAQEKGHSVSNYLHGERRN